MVPGFGDNSEIGRRVTGLVIALASAAPLVIALALSADEAGHGTHTQLGLPACGWVIAFDTPCPTCGMTTAFTHAASGDVLAAVVTQPLGAALAVLAAAAVWGGLHVTLTGCRLHGLVHGLLSARSLWAIATAASLAWVYKILTW